MLLILIDQQVLLLIGLVVCLFPSFVHFMVNFDLKLHWINFWMLVHMFLRKASRHFVQLGSLDRVSE